MNKLLEELYSTTATPGWRLLIEDAEEKQEALKEALVSTPYDAYSYGVVQGRIQVYREIVGLREACSVALKDQEDIVDE